MKCSLTHEGCPFYGGGWGTGELCKNYKNSDIIYRENNPHYSKSRGREDRKIYATFDDTCRYYGIARSKELKAEFEKNGEVY
jgi:hypothetical protein